jgi:rare lipoprotein A (peptidoglycan hydrolase)
MGNERISRRDFLREKIPKALGVFFATRQMFGREHRAQRQKTCWITDIAIQGDASEYDTLHCLGCSSGQIMSNGERLNDTEPMLACNRLPLNSMVQVTNFDTGLSTIARVTDHGGFEGYGRIADLSYATAVQIGFDFYKGIVPIELRLLYCE